MTKKEFVNIVRGLLFALVCNVLGWGLAFSAGAKTIRPGWGPGLLSNIPLGIVILIGLLIATFDDKNWVD